MVKAIAATKRVEHLRGQVVCQERSPSTHIYIIGRGEYELTIKAPDTHN